MPARIVGVETEYGLTGRSLAGERPRRLSVGEAAQLLFEPVEREHASTNVFLGNGGRLYLDVGSHPEYATPECRSVADLLVRERAGDDLLARLAVRAGREAAADGRPVELRLFKNNVDPHGNSYGCHENYSIPRTLSLAALAARLTPFLVTRQVLCGTGRWRSDGFRISQRADLLHEQLSSLTTRTRPLINTRDEPLADPGRFRRLHVIAGDSNLSEPSAALKVGSALAVLDALEESPDALPNLELADVPTALRAVARDPRALLTLSDGRSIGALDVQAAYADAVVDSPLRARWTAVLQALADDREDDLAGEVEWVAKRQLLRRYADSRGLAGDDRRLAQVDLAFHDITTDDTGRPRGLFRLLEARGAAVRLTDPAAVRQAMDVPPADTRAALRGRLVRAAGGIGRRCSVDWVQFTVHDLPGPDGSAEVAVRLEDPFASVDDRVDALERALSGGRRDPGPAGGH